MLILPFLPALPYPDALDLKAASGWGCPPGIGGDQSSEEGKGFAKVEVERNWGVLAFSLQKTVLKEERTAGLPLQRVVT